MSSRLKTGKRAALTAEQRKAFHHLTAMNSCSMLVYFALYGSVLWLFVDRLGFSSALVGALSLAVQLPIVVQLWAARHADRYGCKRMMITFLLWGPLTLLPFLFAPELSRWLGPWATTGGIFFGLVVYSLMTSIAFAAWMPLVRRNVPKRRATELVGRMNQIGMAIAVVATFGFGFFLGENPPLWRFKAIFLCGVAMAFLRIVWLSKVNDLEPANREHSTSLWSDLRTVWANRPFWRLVLFVVLTNMTLGILVPFRPIYVKALGFSERFAAISTMPCILAAYGATAYVWGLLADRYGSRGVYVLAGSGAILGQLIMILPQGNGVLNGVALILGLMMFPAAWAGIDAGNTRRLFTVVPQENQSLFMSIMMITVCMAIAFGGFLGGLSLDVMRSLLPEASAENGFARALEYRLLFLVSSALTVVAVGYSRRMRDLKEVSTQRMLLHMRLRTQRWLLRGRGAALFFYRVRGRRRNNER